MTVFVAKDGAGNILGVFAAPQDDPAWASVVEMAETDPAVVAYLAPPKAKPTPLDWFMRLSSTTQAALDTAARTDNAVSLALRYASGVSFVDVADARTKQNVDLLLSKGLITQAEHDTLLAP